MHTFPFLRIILSENPATKKKKKCPEAKQHLQQKCGSSLRHTSSPSKAGKGPWGKET